MLPRAHRARRIGGLSIRFSQRVTKRSEHPKDLVEVFEHPLLGHILEVPKV